ncbi:MAG: helix-turn-helix transcriptional regulator [Acidobacteria bacterium]|nr:helix-turn-helix transcriptional regulator [Acidobacteriota bacterium]
MAKKSTTIAHEKSSGNVFADLGLPHLEQKLLKARLTLQIYRNIKARRLTQAQAGEILGIKQPHVSLLLRNRSGNIPVERLIDFLTGAAGEPDPPKHYCTWKPVHTRVPSSVDEAIVEAVLQYGNIPTDFPQH